jgi:hypothetical protein
MGLSATLAVVVAVGVFLLTSRAMPGLSTSRAPLRLLAVADAAMTTAVVVVVAVDSMATPLYLAFWIHVAAAAALLWRIGGVNAAVGNVVAAAWARTGACAFVAWTLIGNFLLASGAAYAIGLDVAAMGGLITIALVATLRGARRI